MGAVCYKPKPTTITQADILRALNDKHLKASITEPDGVKTLKTDQYSNNLLTFGAITQMFQYETTAINETHTNQQNNLNTNNNNAITANNNGMFQNKLVYKSQKKNMNLNPHAEGLGQLELNILTYFGAKDQIYDTLTHLSRKSLYFMKRNYRKIESHPKLRNANEKIKFIHQKSIEEHTSGVNQLIKLNSKELVTASDDCFMKFWTSTNMKVETALPTETITCIALTGGLGNSKQKDIIVAGCHSGNLLLVSVTQRIKKEQVNNAHYNLIRVIVTLESLKNKFFVSADVCGIVKVWTSQFKPQQVMEIQQDGAISYNSMIEIEDMLPKRSSYEDTAVIACALKSQRINLILLMPNSGTYQLIKTLRTQQKPTCLIQLTSKHIAIAVGQLKEGSSIEVHDVNKSKMTAQLCFHKDMIDSMLKLEFPAEKSRSQNKYITWFVSASRDRQIALWKLIDGKIVTRNIITQMQPQQRKSLLMSGVTPKNAVGKRNSQNQNLYQQSLGMAIQSSSGNQHNKANNRNNLQSSINQISKFGMGQKGIEASNKQQKNRQKGQNDNDSDEEEDVDYQRSQEEESNFQYEEFKQDDRNLMMSDVSNIQFKSEVEVTSPSFAQKTNSQLQQMVPQAVFQNHYFAFDTGHKDFIRSMAQINNGNMLVTASEDKFIKVFSITF